MNPMVQNGLILTAMLGFAGMEWASRRYQDTVHADANDHPSVERLVEPRAVHCHALERHGRQHKGDQHPENGQRMGKPAADDVAPE